MEQEDNPYDILGVHQDASESQIRSAYRKAALRNHPDKVSEDERPAATIKFAKISNAYEILSDPEKRELYHEEQRQRYAYDGHQRESSSPFFNEDPFFAHAGFHDPFQVFHSVFREEFGGPRASFSRHGGGSRRAAAAPQSPMDAFFGATGGGGPFGDPFLGSDPFFGGNDDFFGGGSIFGRGIRGGRASSRRTDPFDEMFDRMHQMNSHMRQVEDQMRGNNGNHQQSFYYSSSSSSSGFGGGRESVTTQTTRRIVNGQEETFTERIVRKADGTVERQVLDNSMQSANNRLQDANPEAAAALPSGGVEGAAGSRSFSRLLPWRRRGSKQAAEDMVPSKRSPAEADAGSQKRRREP